MIFESFSAPLSSVVPADMFHPETIMVITWAISFLLYKQVLFAWIQAAFWVPADVSIKPYTNDGIDYALNPDHLTLQHETLINTLDFQSSFILARDSGFYSLVQCFFNCFENFKTINSELPKFLVTDLAKKLIYDCKLVQKRFEKFRSSMLHLGELFMSLVYLLSSSPDEASLRSMAEPSLEALATKKQLFRDVLFATETVIINLFYKKSLLNESGKIKPMKLAFFLFEKHLFDFYNHLTVVSAGSGVVPVTRLDAFILDCTTDSKKTSRIHNTIHAYHLTSKMAHMIYALETNRVRINNYLDQLNETIWPSHIKPFSQLLHLLYAFILKSHQQFVHEYIESTSDCIFEVYGLLNSAIQLANSLIDPALNNSGRDKASPPWSKVDDSKSSLDRIKDNFDNVFDNIWQALDPKAEFSPDFITFLETFYDRLWNIHCCIFFGDQDEKNADHSPVFNMVPDVEIADSIECSSESESVA